MGVTIPSLEGQTYIRNTQSVIGYTLRRYSRTPKETVPLLPDLIISLQWRMAESGRDPDALTASIQTDLQTVFDRIFANERRVRVSCTYTMVNSIHYNVTLSVIYTLLNGEIEQYGATITLNKDTGQFVIPEDQINWVTGPYRGD